MNETIDNDRLPVPRSTIADMVREYLACENEIRDGFHRLRAAEQRFLDAFPESYFHLKQEDMRSDLAREKCGVETLAEMKKRAWGSLVKKMEVRRILSMKRAEELDRQIETGEGLPDITEANILAILESTIDSAKAFLDEAVQEVFEWLRPHGDKYKTNSQFEIGKRVILGWTVERGFNGDFRVGYHYEKRVMALDNVFHGLDGKSFNKTHYGPLHDAINQSSNGGTGQTDYFKFKACANRNLHVEFLRPDLVAKLNAVAGGNRLRAAKTEAAS